MKKKTLYYIIGTLVVLIVLLLALKSKGVIGGDDSTKVSAEKAAYRDIVETVSASGKIYPEIVVKVSPDVSGEITDLPVIEGDSVTRGQVVAKIYADIYSSIKQRSAASVSQMQAQLANAQASVGAFKAALDQQQAAYNRNKQLMESKVISKSEFEQSESAYKSALANYNAAEAQVKSGHFAVATAQADLSQANDNLRRTTIVAPMSGVISYLAVKKGERVVGTAQMAGTEMMRIADMNVMEVQVNVGENDIPKVMLGDTATIEVDAYGDRKFKGIVTQIASSSSDVATQTTNTVSTDQVTNYIVHIRILRSSYQNLIDPQHPRHFPFRPGMSANVDIQTKHHYHVLSVPINAVTTRQDTSSTNGGKPGRMAKAAPKGGNDTASASGTGTITGQNANAQEVVFAVQKNGTVKLVSVKTDIQDDNYIEITSGLEDGEEVVTGPYNAVSRSLKNGAKVNVVPKSQLFEATASQ